MQKALHTPRPSMKKRHRSFALLIGTGLFVAGFVAVAAASAPRVSFIRTATSTPASALNTRVSAPPLDIAAYNKKLLELGAVATSSPWYAAFLDDTVASTTSPRPRWPVKTVYPNVGAILPFKRIVAYYGNFYSKGMGALGEYPTDQMLAMLGAEVKRWEAADPTTPVLPAIQYIAVVAQMNAGKEGKYILRMPDDQIEHTLDLANRVHGIVILDV